MCELHSIDSGERQWVPLEKRTSVASIDLYFRFQTHICFQIFRLFLSINPDDGIISAAGPDGRTTHSALLFALIRKKNATNIIGKHCPVLLAHGHTMANSTLTYVYVIERSHLQCAVSQCTRDVKPAVIAIFH